MNVFELSHHQHDASLKPTYIPCECGKPGCTGNAFTCPWVLGTPRPAPYLYLENMTDGGIELSWTDVYGEDYYKIYRAPSESGPWSAIAQTVSYEREYYDYPNEAGTYWYFVQAFNENGGGIGSNKLSGYGTPEIESKQLIGSHQRYFPNEDKSKLGFVINTTSAPWDTTLLRFSIREVINDPQPRDFNIYVDGFLVSSVHYDIPLCDAYCTNREISLLTPLGSHTIEFEIDSGYIDAGTHYKLEYANISRLFFNENYIYYDGGNTYRYTPGYIHEDVTQGDNLVVSLNVDPPYTNPQGTTNGDFYFQINPVIEMNPNSGNYIDYISLEYRLLKPNGEFYQSEDLESGNLKTSHCNDGDYSTEIDSVLSLIGYFITVLGMLSDMAASFLLPIDTSLALINLPKNGDDVIMQEIEPAKYQAAWGIGYSANPYGGFIPNDQLKKLSLRYRFGLSLATDDAFGNYQLQLKWRVHICALVLKIGGALMPEFRYSVSDEYYVNFNYGNKSTNNNPPAQVQGLSANGGQNSIDLSWNANTEQDLDYYKIYRNGNLHTTTRSTSYSDIELFDSMTHSYQVSAVNKEGLEGQVSGSEDATTDYDPPAQVQGLSANGGENRIDLSWNANTEQDLDYYKIYRNGNFLTTTTSTNYADTGLPDSATRTYRISAVDKSGLEGPKSNSETAITDSGSSGGGCPILSVFDGEQYQEEGLLDIHDPEGYDIIYQHELNYTPVVIDNRFHLKLTEHPKTISHIDKVELWGVLSNGMKIKLPLLSAIHNEEGQVCLKLWFSDDRKVDAKGADHNNGTSQWIDLEFIAPSIEFENYFFVIEGNNMFIK
jgi:fibronectin type 3 domain-containing protein